MAESGVLVAVIMGSKSDWETMRQADGLSDAGPARANGPLQPKQASAAAAAAPTSMRSFVRAARTRKRRCRDDSAGHGNRGAGQDGGTYTVIKGDTLSSIAKTHSVEVSQLREWNNLKSDNIKLGQKLRVSSKNCFKLRRFCYSVLPFLKTRRISLWVVPR